MSDHVADTTNTSASQLNFRDQAPLWQYVTKIEKMGTGGGNTAFQCNFCHQIYRGSYFRVKCHLLKTKGGGIASCSKVTSAILLELNQVVEEAELRVKQSLPRQVPLPYTMASGSSSKTCSTGASNYYGLQMQLPNVEPKKRKGMEGPLEKAFNNNAREELDGEIARMFYTGGLSFHFARNPHYVRAFTKAYNNPIVGYVPPGYNALRTTLLQKEKTSIERMLGPIKDSWKDKGVSVCSDGWSDSQRRPLINIMAVSESGPMFLRAVNCEGEYKDKHFIANLLIESIREIGPQNVVQVITDNAAACKAAGLLVEAKFQHIFWIPCVVHTLNLALKNICSPSSHPSMRLAMFNDHSKLKLLSIAETRFASAIVMLKRFKQRKQSLEHMVITPIYEMLRMADTDTPCLHLVYEWWDSMIEKVKIVIFRKERKQLNEESRFFDVVYGILVERWTKSSTPLHCLAHSLNPRYYHKQWLEECPGRVPPHKDIEITRERKKCLERYFYNAGDRRKIYGEFANFSGAIEDFASSDSVEDQGFMSPMKWWLFHGTSTPTLQSIAFKLLGQPCSSSCCERNWSTYNFIHSMRRNKMTPQRAEDLVYVHTNLRLLSRRSPTYNEGPSQQWDVGGDGFDSMNMDNSGILEIADLSLDEPDLEAVLFSSSDSVIVDE
ncbi:hypothetical protein JRO89_XS11G0035900 [Xanthoceras sorbifolium]|uniref:BED-type domain-containing protein n=1 Tax=Xanthoceras sorbifolium TaxID=99658 RepID=A0ABQ8HEL5_9ROSI|nr:hypothetical protein JRO89_XS11G0035900 [Xanthoceras sorbifolium]